MQNPHDQLFKSIFWVPENAEGELRYLLPPGVSERLDWKTLTKLDVAFAGSERRVDATFSVQFDGREVLLYLLLEHQSTSDRWMPLRLLRYMLELWNEYLKKHKHAKRLPAVIPMVVHHSEAGWSAPMQFGELLDLDESGWQLLGHVVPTFEYLLDDVSDARSGDLKRRVMTAIGRLTLLGLSRARRKRDLLPELRAWSDLIAEAASAANGVAALAALLRYILATSETDPDSVYELLKQLGPREELAFMTGAEILTERVRIEAEAHGRAEIVLKQLALKFGALSEEHVARVRESSVEELELYAERVLSVESLDAVFAE